MRNCRCFFDIFSLFFSLERLEYAANACFVDFFECKVPAKLVFSFIKTTFCQLQSTWKAGDWTNVYAEIVEQWVEGTKKLHQPMSWCSVLLEVQIALEREQDYFLSQLFLSPQPCSPQQPFFSLHSFLQSFMQPFLQDFLSSFLQHFLSSFLQHFLLSFLQQDSFLSACFTSCAAALRPKVSKATNAKHLATEFALNSCILFVF